jgi:hypothetical protein
MNARCHRTEIQAIQLDSGKSSAQEAGTPEKCEWYRTILLIRCGRDHDVQPRLECSDLTSTYLFATPASTINTAVVLQADQHPLVALCIISPGECIHDRCTRCRFLHLIVLGYVVRKPGRSSGISRYGCLRDRPHKLVENPWSSATGIMSRVCSVSASACSGDM